MARHIRMPGVVDVVLVRAPEEIRAFDEAPSLDRNFIARGPLVNRLITGRIRRWFAIKGQLLPSLALRGDPIRAERQKQLAAELDPAGGRALWSDAELDALANYVRGEGSDEAAAVTTQHVVGRLFDSGYSADRASWNAAVLIDKFRDGFSPIQIVWEITGQLRRAWNLLVARAKQDRWAMHGTAIGVHGIVQALARMRDLRALPHPASLGDDAVLWKCLAPPKQVPRTVETLTSSPFVDSAIRPGSIVILQLGAAGPCAPDAEMVFMRGHWNACPAAAFVTALLRSVWHRSLKGSGSA
jgi:hypothetical protein